MKLRNLFCGVMAAAMAFVACDKKEDFGTPAVSIIASEIVLSSEAGDTTITVTATRDWTVTVDEAAAEWLAVDPVSGSPSTEAQAVTLSYFSNDGYDREASVAFSIGMQTKYLTVTQKGTKGSADALVIYANDMNAGKVEKVDDNWPYPDQSTSWNNEKGSGIANVKYASSGVTVRSVSSTNNLWFPAKGGSYFSVQHLALNSTKSLELTFNTVHGSPNGYKKEFSTSAFKVFVSKDSKKWVELPYELIVKAENEFDQGKAVFTVADTEELSMTWQFLGAEDGYRLTNISLSVYEGEGASAVDFTQAVEMDFTSTSSGDNGGNGGGEVTPPTDAIFFESFASGKGNFTIDDKTLPEGLTYVWYEDTQYKNMKASAFKDNVKYATESWLISPEVDLTSVTAAYLLFEHTGKFFGTMADEATVYAKKAGGEWAKLTIPTYMSGNDWTFVSSGAIDLKDYVGGKMQFAFKYVSTSNAAGTWEIKNVCVSPTAESTGGNTGGGNTGGGNTGGDTNGDNTGDGTGGNTGTAEDFESGTYSYTFEKGVIKGAGNLVLNKLAWNLDATDFTYVGFDATKGLQIGSSNNPALNITLKTESIKGTIKSVKVNTSGAKDTDATLSVTVGGNAFGQAATLTNTATDYTFEGSATGTLELVWNLTKKAVYIKSIEVVVE